MMSLKKNYWLWLIFVLALVVRLYCFTGSTYFGFDEARDAFVSQAIYKQGDLKLIGPPANAPGLNHGVLHWYIIGIFYLIGSGSPFVVSFIFRVINALAILPVFYIANKLFGKRTAYLAVIIFAVSFEASQYAMYYGNPSLAVLSWMSLFAGAVVIYKEKNKFWGLPLMALGIASGAQFELFLATLGFVGLVILGILRRELKKIGMKSWLVAIIIGLGIDFPYILGELTNGFRSVKTVIGLVTSGYGVSGSASRWVIFLKRWVTLLHDNFLPADKRILWSIAVIFLFFWIFQARKKIEYRLILVWVLGGVFIFMFGGYSAYYINVGIGTGLIIGLAAFIDKVLSKNGFLGIILVFFALSGNLAQVLTKNRDGLIEDIKTQQYMFLADEVKVINKMYFWANGRPFTIRITSMPYRMQTVWAYLFDQYGKPVYGYLPYYETGNVLGYPGYLPEPKNGTTCLRFLLREPIWGIPKHLIDKDIKDEKVFSTVEGTMEIGHFKLEKRLSKDKDCHENIFP